MASAFVDVFGGVLVNLLLYAFPGSTRVGAAREMLLRKSCWCIMGDLAALKLKVIHHLGSGAPSYAAVAAAYALIETHLVDLGGVKCSGLVRLEQLERFNKSMKWQPDSPGRRMTVAEASAFVSRLVLALPSGGRKRRSRRSSSSNRTSSEGNKA